jgi:VanZ family protein
MNARRSLFLRNVAWAIVVFALCAVPGSVMPGRMAIPHADKVVHFTLFLVMGFLARGAWRGGTWRVGLLVVLGCAAYGGLIEVLQERYFHRGGEWLDLLADVAGAVAGCLACHAWRQRGGMLS